MKSSLIRIGIEDMYILIGRNNMKRNYDLYISLSTDLLKYYVSKASGKLKLSKNPVEHIYTSLMYCREQVCGDFADALSGLRENFTKSGNALEPYVFEVTPYKVIDGIEYSCKSDIILNLGSTINARKMFADSKVLDNIINLLHLYVGLTDTIIYDGDARLRQKKLEGKVTDNVVISDTTLSISYGCCSPEFLSNPYTTSLYLGIARDCISLISDNTINVLKSVNMDEVKKVINKGDTKRAREILIDIALPYLNSDEVGGVVEYEEDELYDEENDEYYTEEEEIYYDTGTQECNILTEPTIREHYFAFLNKEITYQTIDIYEAWRVCRHYSNPGIYTMRELEDE